MVWTQERKTILRVCVLILLVEYSVTNLLNDQADKKVETPEDEDPIEKANKAIKDKVFEGDIALTKQDLDNVDLRQNGDIAGQAEEGILRKRSAITDKRNLWPNGEVPIEITKDLQNFPGMMNMINSAVNEFHKYTCVRLRFKQPGDRYWVRMVRKPGCYSAVGRQYLQTHGAQEVSIGPNCESKGIIMHELMHALGFYHEQSRYDRDSYIMVRWNNVQPGLNMNFNKGRFDEVDAQGLPYDMDSLMHYENYELSGNKLPTIQAIRNHAFKIGQRAGFTKIDVLKIQLRYKCRGRMNGMKKRTGTSWGEWSEYSACDIDCRRFRERLCAKKNLEECPEANKFGLQIEYQPCPASECNVPIDGNWGRWSEWDACSTSCGMGTQRRQRLCNSPNPHKGGKPCEGEVLKQRQCEQPNCPVIGRRRRKKSSIPRKHKHKHDRHHSS